MGERNGASNKAELFQSMKSTENALTPDGAMLQQSDSPAAGCAVTICWVSMWGAAIPGQRQQIQGWPAHKHTSTHMFLPLLALYFHPCPLCSPTRL